MAELKPCPFCGKKPKIHYYPVNIGWAVCNPVFRKPHLETGAIFESPSKLKEAIIEEWNKEVEECLN